FACERTDLIAEDGRRLQRQPARGFVGRLERDRERVQLAKRGSQHGARGGELAESRARLRERARQQVQRALPVRVLLREDLKDGVRGVDELGELLVLAAQRFDQKAEVVDRAGDVGVAYFQLRGDSLALARERVEALQRRPEGPAVFLEAFARTRQQLLQISPRFRVQARQELVEI